MMEGSSLPMSWASWAQQQVLARTPRHDTNLSTPTSTAPVPGVTSTVGRVDTVERLPCTRESRTLSTTVCATDCRRRSDRVFVDSLGDTGRVGGGRSHAPPALPLPLALPPGWASSTSSTRPNAYAARPMTRSFRALSIWRLRRGTASRDISSCWLWYMPGSSVRRLSEPLPLSSSS